MCNLPKFLSVNSLPHSILAVRQVYETGLKEVWRDRWKGLPKQLRMLKFDVSMPSGRFMKLIKGMG